MALPNFDFSNPGGGEHTYSVGGQLYRRYGDGPIQLIGPDPNAGADQMQTVTPPALTQSGNLIPPNASGATGAGGGGMTATGTAPSMAALNKAVEPDPNTTSGGGANAALTALAGLTGGGGATGNQEQTGSALTSNAGMFRALGRRNPPEGSLKLNRKAY